MADWILPVTTLGAAGITALLAYAGARTSIGVVKVANAEEHWRERRTTYRLLADQLVRFEEAMERPGVAAGFYATPWFKSYSHLANGTRLFAPVVVRDAVDEYERARRALFDDAQGLSVADLRTAYESHRTAIRSARSRLLHAMRDDLAPDPPRRWTRLIRGPRGAQRALTREERELERGLIGR